MKDGSFEGRRYVKLAMFWDYRVWQKFIDDPTQLRTLKPEQASQHARLYLPIGSQPAIVVATQQRDEVAPVPSQIGDFAAGWILSPSDLKFAQALGVPGF